MEQARSASPLALAASPSLSAASLQMKSAQADAAKLQAELTATFFEGFSSDETVKATVDGSQARSLPLRLAVLLCVAAHARPTRRPVGAQGM